MGPPVPWYLRLPWAALVVLAVAFVVPLYVVLSYQQALPDVAAGALASIPTSVVVAWLILKLQEPKVVVSLEPGATIGNKDTYWLHARADNVALGLMGGGRAHEVTGELHSAGDGATKRFHLKWSSKREPIGTALVPTAGGLAIATGADPSLFEQAKVEEIRPGGNRDLGIGFKMQGDANFYIFEPESYSHPDWKNPNNRFPPGIHRFKLVVLYDGAESKPLELEITNDGSTEKSSVRATAR
jgi:hypothetical protein